MASGLSVSLRYTTRSKKLVPLPRGASRDRSLPGKARIRARREENRALRESLRA